MVLDKKGNLYGAASLKGAYGYGNVFKLTPSQQGRWTESVLHAFSDTTGDGWPTAGLVLDTAGNLYGTTPQGGTGSGKVFKLTPNPDGTWAESILYQFTGGKDGGHPYGWPDLRPGGAISTALPPLVARETTAPSSD